MSVFKLETEEVARELRVVVLQDLKDFDTRTEDMPPGVHVVDMPHDDLVVLSNKNVYNRPKPNEDIWLPLTYDKKTRVGRVSKVASDGLKTMILLEDQKTLWGAFGRERYDHDGIFNARDPVINIARSDRRSYSSNTYYPMLTNVPREFIPLGVKINDISWLLHACCAALSNGTILMWGKVKFPPSRGSVSGGLKILSVPGMRPRGQILSLASGFQHIVWVVKHEDEPGGRVCVYGINNQKQCGIAGISFCEPMEITTVPGLSGMVKSVGCGNNSSFALTVDGRIFVWGRGMGGELGQSAWAPTSKILPTEILPPIEGAKWLKMACGISSIALYGYTNNEILGVATWGRYDSVGRFTKKFQGLQSFPPRDIDFLPELMELLMGEDPKYVNLVTYPTFANIIFTRDDFRQEFDWFDMEERLDFGGESGMYKQVRRRRRW